MAVIILAGGQSRRLGRDKAWQTVGGVALITRVLDAADGLPGEVFVVANEPDKYEALAGRAEIRRDETPNLGPLGGLYTGLLATSDRDNLLLPCDAPFLKPELLHFLLDQLAGHDAVVPEYKDRAHPAIAAYATSCLPAIEKQITLGHLKVNSFFPDADVLYLVDAAISELDPDGLSFFNVNTAADLAQAECLAGQR